MKRQSLRDEIIRLYTVEKKTVTEIAKIMGCSKPNVSMAIKRALRWNQVISPLLPEFIVSWIMDEAVRQDKPPATVARDIIIKAYHTAKESE
jgi:DNA-binding transcriptional regulator LsrR (DeoR family)